MRIPYRKCFVPLPVITVPEILGGVSYTGSEIIYVHKKKKNKGNITKPCFLTLIRITMVLLPSAILVRYMKVYPKFCSLPE